MKNYKFLEKPVRVLRKKMSEGLSIAQVTDDQLGSYLDPYLMIDHFEMALPFFRPHPHAGFSAVTYMFPESANGFVNRDSLGNKNLIPPGAIHWTAAGKGVVHEEVPIERGVVCHGLQIFINLHSSKKLMNPQALHADPHEIPVVKADHSEVRIVVGEYQNRKSHFAPPVEVQFLDVVLGQGAVFEHTLPSGYKGFIYAIEGKGEAHGELIDSGQVAGVSEKGETLKVTSTSSRFHFVVAMGLPLNEPVVFHGPFVMNTEQQIHQAIEDYQSGKMGRLEASF